MSPRPPDELSSDLRAVIDAARGAHEPNELSRARVHRSLELKLVAGAALAIGPAASALAGAMKVVLVVASVSAAVGAGVYALPRHAPAPPARHGAVNVVRTVRAPIAPPVSPPAAAEPPAAVPAAVRAHHRLHMVARPAAPDGASGLRAETALLASANAALSAHQADRALSLLADYDSRASAGTLSGVLAEERAATGVLALCEAGHVGAARMVARHFHARWPRSPLAARIDGSCAGRAWPTTSTTTGR
jgi:hypothetical protein